MLREAQQNSMPVSTESQNKKTEVTRLEKQEKLSFSLFFDEYKGSAHLEALAFEVIILFSSSQTLIIINVVKEPWNTYIVLYVYNM